LDPVNLGSKDPEVWIRWKASKPLNAACERGENMLRLSLAVPILWICAASRSAAQVNSQSLSPESPACHIYDMPAQHVSIKRLRLHPDLEGSYGEDLRCPERTLDVRFSKSDLYTDQYKDLLSFIMGGNSAGPRYVDMDVIADLVDTKAPNGKPAIMVRKIEKYTTGIIKL
jgi:hypothetical protein